MDNIERHPPRGAPAGKERVRSRTPLTLFLLSSSYIAITLNIQGFVGMLPLVQREFVLSGAQAGLYTSFYFLSATIIAVLSGRIVDRIGTGWGLILGVGTVAIMMLLHAISPVYALILIFAFFTGMGFSLITPSVSKGVIENVSSGRRASAMGVVHGVGGSGALIGTAVLPFLGQLYGWRVVLAASGAIAGVIALTIYRFYPRKRRDEAPPSAVHADETTGSPAAGDEAPKSFRREISEVLGNGPLITICVLGVVFGMSLSSITGHMTLFLAQDLGYTPAAAGIGLAAFHVGGIVGQPSWGVINDRLLGGRRRFGLIALALLTTAMGLFFGLVVSTGVLPFSLILVSSGLFGFIVLGIPGLYFTSVSELVPGRQAGLATGIALVFSRTGVVLAAPVFGFLSDRTGDYSASWIALASVVFLFAATVISLSHRYKMP